jgi:flagellar hook-associated protein 3 FlgL
MRISTDMIFQRGTNGILDQQAQVSKTQLQMSSGKNVSTPSDNPTAAVQILQLQHSIDLTNTYQTNIGYAQASLNVEESTLSSSNDFLQRIRELAVQANSGVMSNTDLQSIAQEVQQDLQGLVGLANSQDGSGNYVFAGNRTTTQPFSQSGGGFPYSGDQGQRTIQIGANRKVAITDSGYDVFQNIKNGNGTFVTSYGSANTGSGVISAGQVTDPGAWVPDTYTLTFLTPTTYEVRDSSAALVASGSYQSDAAISFNGAQVSVSGAPAAGDTYTISPSANQDVFATVQKLATTLNTGITDATSRANFSSDINQVLVSIDQAMNNLTNVRATIGARQNAIDNQQSANSDLITASQTAQSALQDLDYTSAATRLSQQTLALQAAQQSFVKMQNLSLFNYIQ